MIITDGVHLVSTDSEQELHSFAHRMGLRRQWYQNHPRHPHYDLTTPGALRRAREKGAVKVEVIELLNTAWWAQATPEVQR
jgi:hypothetical protein